MLVITQALESYRKNFRFYASLVLAPGIIIMLLAYGLMIFSPNLNGNWFVLLPYIAGIIFYALLIGALLYAVSEKEQQHQPRIKGSLVFGIKQGWKPTLLLVILATATALPCYVPPPISQIAPLIWFFYYSLVVVLVLRYILLFPVWLLEKRGLIESLHYAATLAKGRRTGLIVEFLALLIMLRVSSMMLQMLLFFPANALIHGANDWLIVFFFAIIDPLLYTLLILWIYYSYQQSTQMSQEDILPDSYQIH